MITAGMHGPQIAYNEHRTAPATSPLGRRADPAVRRANRNAAKARRAAGAPPGPRQPQAPTPRRRAVLRQLRRNVKRALRTGETVKATRLMRAAQAMFAGPVAK